jgi:hypothetical protein
VCLPARLTTMADCAGADAADACTNANAYLFFDASSNLATASLLLMSEFMKLDTTS